MKCATNPLCIWADLRPTFTILHQPRRAQLGFGPPSPRCAPAHSACHRAIGCRPVKAQPVEICARVRVQPIGPSRGRGLRFWARGRCYFRYFRYTQSRFRAQGRCYTCYFRYTGRGVSLFCSRCSGCSRCSTFDFGQLRAHIKPHRAPPARCASFPCALHREQMCPFAQ